MDARVLRGGSFNNNDNNVRCAYRNYNNITNHNNNIGFRVCVPHLSQCESRNLARLRFC
jgi:formylglycine-generating enzyme required for sulfatase activity